MSDPIDTGTEANEADVAEQTQPVEPLDGAELPPAVTSDEANEADALEQATSVNGSDDDYPHAVEEDER